MLRYAADDVRPGWAHIAPWVLSANENLMNKLNWEIIRSNIAEAREQLEEIEKRAKSRKPPCKEELQIMLQHAYHHMNFAWNARHQSTKWYAHLTDADFDAWKQFPSDIEF